MVVPHACVFTSALSITDVQAAARGDVERIAWCIAHKGDVHWRDPNQGARTALHVACGADRRRAVAVLLLHGADM